MKGTVIAYSPAVNSGVLKGEDGRTFYFSLAEWQSRQSPAAGLKINFSPSLHVARAISDADKRPGL